MRVKNGLLIIAMVCWAFTGIFAISAEEGIQAMSDEEMKEYIEAEAKVQSFFTGTWNSTKDKYNPQVKIVFEQNNFTMTDIDQNILMRGYYGPVINSDNEIFMIITELWGKGTLTRLKADAYEARWYTLEEFKQVDAMTMRNAGNYIGSLLRGAVCPYKVDKSGKVTIRMLGNDHIIVKEAEKKK